MNLNAQSVWQANLPESLFQTPKNTQVKFVFSQKISALLIIGAADDKTLSQVLATTAHRNTPAILVTNDRSSCGHRERHVNGEKKIPTAAPQLIRNP
jgi:hypothetical protein